MNYFQLRQLGIRMSNAVKGFIRTITGAPPITLESCMDEESVINYQLYGNSVQDGEPSPDNPVDVVSVGEKTKNLFNPKVMFNNINKVNGLEVTYNNDGSFNLIGTTNNTYTFVYNKVVFPVSAGETFTFSVTYECDKNPVFGAVFCNGSTTSTQIIVTNGNNASETTTKDSANLGFRISGVTANTYYEIRNIRLHLERGETDTEYEPYGYKIPVTAHGKNLVDVNMLTDMNNCTVSTKGDVVGHYFTNLINGKTYTLYFKYEKTIPTNGSIGIYNGSSAIASFANKEGTITFVANNTRIRCYIPSPNGGVSTFQQFPLYLTIMIEEGSIATEYEPYKEPITTNIYLNEPLRAIGDYKDYIDFESRKLVRNIFETSIVKPTNFANNIIYRKQSNIVRISNRVNTPIQKPYYLMLSNIFKCISEGWLDNKECIFHHNNTYSNYYFSLLWTRLGLTYDGTNVYKTSDTTQTAMSDIEIVAVVFEYMDSLPEKDKKLYMVLKEPTEETIDLSNLPTFKGNTKYTIDTTIQPTNMVVNYYSTTKGE